MGWSVVHGLVHLLAIHFYLLSSPDAGWIEIEPKLNYSLVHFVFYYFAEIPSESLFLWYLQHALSAGDLWREAICHEISSSCLKIPEFQMGFG